MKMEQFADKLYKEIVKELGREVRAEVREVRKNNGVILHGLLVRKQGQDVAATIYLDTFLEAYESGMAFRPIVRKVLDICREEWDREPVDCHPANYLEPFSSVYLDVLSGPNSVMVRLNGGYSA